jgi:hypothetical protein
MFDTVVGVIHADGWDYVSELQLATGLLFIPHVTYVYGEPLRNDVDSLKPKNSEINLSHYCCIHHKCHMEWPECVPRPPLWEAGV